MAKEAIHPGKDSLFNDEHEDTRVGCEQESGEDSRKSGSNEKSRPFNFGAGATPQRKLRAVSQVQATNLEFVGKAYPCHPGPPPNEPEGWYARLAIQDFEVEYKKWKSKAHKYAMYYLVALCPEESLYCSNQPN